jgi:regulator of replication initiation timing
MNLFDVKLDETFLELLQETILSHVSELNPQIPAERYVNPPKAISKEEIEKVFISFNVKMNREEIRKLRTENQKLKRENQEMKSQIDEIKIQKERKEKDMKIQIDQMKQEIERLKNPYSQPVQVNLSCSSGIISYLNSVDSNPVLLITSSSYGSTMQQENILKTDENCHWLSKNELNSWIIFNFQNKNICPQGYLIRKGSINYQNSPQGWKLEGSNDQKNWVILNEVKNCDVFKKEKQEGIFRFETCQFFQFHRFTQIQEDIWKFNGSSPSEYYFLLNFVEFYGKITKT